MKFLVAIGLSFALTACHGRWNKNPEKQIDWIAKKIEKKLDLRPDQDAQFQVLVGQVKAHAKARAEKSLEALKTVKAEFSKDAVDPDKLAALAKAQVQNRPTPQEIDGFIDQVSAFYKTLDPKQQKAFADLVRDKLEWLD